MEIRGHEYYVRYNPKTVTITCQGSLRLRGFAEYEPIVRLLNGVVDENPAQITLNLQELRFLNSSGISVISKFVIYARKQNIAKILVQGSRQISWQGKSLRNLQRLMPNLELELL